MNRSKTFVATGVAPNGRLYAGDLNLIQDLAAALSDFTQTIQLGTLHVGEPGLQLLRYGAGEARISGALRIDGALRIGGDTNLYRSAAGSLKTDGVFRATNLYAEAANGGVTFGPNDTNIYRSTAGVLKTDGLLQAVANLTAQIGASSQVDIGNMGGGVAAIRWGSAFDTNLYRSTVGTLKTDGGFRSLNLVTNEGDVGQQIFLHQNGYIYFGSALDTYLFRSTTGTLKTDGELRAGGTFIANDASSNMVLIGSDGVADNSRGIAFINDAGDAWDTNLYRSGANTLKTDGHFYVVKSLRLDLGDTTEALVFGSAFDTNLYRSATNTLKTDDSFEVAFNVQAGGQVIAAAGFQSTDGGLTVTQNPTPTIRITRAVPAEGYNTVRLWNSDTQTGAVASGILSIGHYNQEWVRVGLPGSGETCLSTNYNDGTGQRGIARVTVGPVDSGGTGYRALRVPN